MTETRIRWEPGTEVSIAAWLGCTGTFGPHLFTILRPVAHDEQYALTAHWPGTIGKVSYDTDPEALKAEAEDWLAEFVSALGATFPAASPSVTS